MNSNLPAGFQESEGCELSHEQEERAYNEVYDTAEAQATGN